MIRLNPKYIPLVATAVVMLGLFGTGSVLYPNFGTPRVIVNLLNDMAFVGVAAVGESFVILSGILRRGLTSALRISCAQGSVTVYRNVFPGIGYRRHFRGRFHPIRPERLCDWLERELGSFDGLADRPDENYDLRVLRTLLRAQRHCSDFLYAIDYLVVAQKS
jgi:hypothetical protein